MSAGLIVFGVIALVVVGSGIAMLLSRNAMYTALFLVLNFSAVAVLYLILGAPFIALAQITVYAGAIMILFLFVIMLLGAERLPGNEPLPAQRIVAILAGLVLMGTAAVVFLWRSGLNKVIDAPPPDFASPSAIGMELFNHYTLPFEITSVILLVAVIGAIVLTQKEIPLLSRKEQAQKKTQA